MATRVEESGREWKRVEESGRDTDDQSQAKSSWRSCEIRLWKWHKAVRSITFVATEYNVMS